MEDRYGFSIFKELFNDDATNEQILETLHSLSFSTSRDADLIIYFAGHGGQNEFSKNGFWASVDCKKAYQRINNSTIYDFIEGIQAKHILLISDSCYSGTFITRTRDGQMNNFTIEQLEAIPSRWVFVSGGEERIGDGSPGKGSPFSNTLCEFLQNNQTPKIPASLVFEHVKRIIRSSTGKNADATHIERTGNEGGQMVFTLTRNRSGEIIQFIKISFNIPALPFEHYISRTVTYYEHQKDEVSYFFQSERGRSYLMDTILTHRKIALLGSAGSGKSVEFLHLALLLQKDSDLYVPLYKKFNTYTGQAIEDYLPEKWNLVDPEALVILLDGLDEIQTQFFFTAVRNIIEFTEKNPAIRIITSCRTNFYELPSSTFSGTIQGFSVFILNDLSLKEINNYATDKLELDGEEFIKEANEASFLDLIQKPYFLNLMIQYYIKNGLLLKDRTPILEEAILNYYIEDKEHYNTTGFPINRPETFNRLEKVAFIMEVMGKNFITDEELHKIFPVAIDFENCKYLPAFRRQDEKNQWMFEHNNIQEFLAARVLSKTPLDKILKIISLSSAGSSKVRPSWVNTISFFLSIDNTKKSVDVLDWIILNDVEAIIRFEPDRITELRRIKIFKEIFEFYSSKQIWLSSNKFSDADLARFGYLDEIIEYLLGILQNKETPRITQLNAINVLDNFKMSD
ncbi:MAG: caspase family protein, partial [Ferruginibacter sp.]